MEAPGEKMRIKHAIVDLHATKAHGFISGMDDRQQQQQLLY